MTKRLRRSDCGQSTLGQGPVDLPPNALKQWHETMSDEPSFRRRIQNKTGPTHADDIWAEVLTSLYEHLKKGGPVQGRVKGYVWTMCKNKISQHFSALAKRAELFVGGQIHLLESSFDHEHIDPSVRVEVERSIAMLREDFTERELQVFVLASAYGMTAPQIAEALREDTSAGAVRQSLMRARVKLNHPEMRGRLGLDPLSE